MIRIKIERMEQEATQTSFPVESKPRRGRRPATEMSEKRAQEIARLERIVATQREKLTKLKEAELKAQRAARRAQVTRLKIAAGGLVSIAGFLEQDRGFVLGTLLQVRDAMSKPEWSEAKYLALKRLGDTELAAREAQRKLGNGPTEE
ncbi:conjugal transfer protein TraD [Xanthomonas euvesicatoria]|uniref:conjugal transfer protein TraD n=1 Tax=Xanthomonas euvesicatoria TaxID=456327 RepID=UPI0024571E54|nr:conjugal transfer protein TraD [Xanthomonas euvesicatoria]MDH4908285.1 conjugal transfer protein TraD [Xanthomonas euvesicatoria]